MIPHIFNIYGEYTRPFTESRNLKKFNFFDIFFGLDIYSPINILQLECELLIFRVYFLNQNFNFADYINGYLNKRIQKLLNINISL